MLPTLDIYSDPICPWCLIGKTRLDRAEAARRAEQAEIGRPVGFARRWRTFQLNPDMPAEGVDRRAYLEAKFGGADGAALVYGRIEDTARADGLEVAFDRIARTPSTVDAHRVVRWAAEANTADADQPGGPGARQDAVMDRLFQAYFFEGQDISDRDLLAEIAAGAGLDAEAVRRALDGDADRDVVAEEDRAARAMGVDGAPTFVLGGRYVLPGAQPSAQWLRVLTELDAEETE